MNSHEDTPTPPFELEGPDDAALEGLLAGLPREEVSAGFTDAVLRRISDAEGSESESLDLIGRASKLLFGSDRSYLSLLAASAAVALALGLGWASVRPDGSGRAPTTVAATGPQTDQDPINLSSNQGSSNQASGAEVDTFRGQPVTTTKTRSSGPARVARPIVRPKTAGELEIQALRADYARLQRELMLLQQLAAEGSPMIEVGSNGEVDFFIDLGEFIRTSKASPSSPADPPVADERREPENF